MASVAIKIIDNIKLKVGWLCSDIPPNSIYTSQRKKTQQPVCTQAQTLNPQHFGSKPTLWREGGCGER